MEIFVYLLICKYLILLNHMPSASGPSSPGFHHIERALQLVPGGSLAQITLYTGFLSMVTASSSGALGIVIPLFGQEGIASGVDPEVIHRISYVASSFRAWPSLA